MRPFSAMLAGGDRRSIGQADRVAAMLRADQSRFDEAFACLAHCDPVVRMRAADALEKFSRDFPLAFEKHRYALLTHSLEDGTPEVRWHLIAIAARLPTDEGAAEKLCHYLADRLQRDTSRIVKATALQAACDLGARFPALASDVSRMLAFAAASPWPSLRARAREMHRAQIGKFGATRNR
jgi:hypothetical protein